MALLLLFGLFVAGVYFESLKTAPTETVTAGNIEIVPADGDSFAIGPRKFRLKGIDAPEYNQICKAADGTDWPCGRSAKAALIHVLTQPGLICSVEYHDRFGRDLANCRTASIPDIGAAQVRNGMAISDDFYGLRSYGDEENAARVAKVGIWQGSFIDPKTWRDMHVR